ncbi:MAG: HDIG domain-containing protein [Bacteroidales bacterium]|nr:HDIG domain-containing protein [Bacteroidales bacterium]MBR1577142.1 HDIG domain-containing protein [Bacteroidales bacterium]
MKKGLYRIAVPLGIAFLLLVLLMPRNAKFAYDYRKGRTWKYETLYAQFDFPIYKTEEQMREERGEASSEAIPYYKFSDEITARNLRAAERLELGNLRSAVVSSMRAIYQKGVMADEGSRRHSSSEPDVIYVQRDKRAVKYPTSEVYRLTEARSRLLSDIAAVSGANVDSLFRAAGVYDLLVPNLLFDEQTTDLVHAESATTVSPTSGYVNAGQLIVQEGEIVTAEIAQMLDSYKREFEANVGYLGPPALLLVGNLLIALTILVLLYLSIYFNNPRIFEDSRFPYLVVVFLLGAVASLILIRAGERFLLLFPFTLVALLLQAFMRNRVVVPVYVVSLLPLLIFSHDGVVLFVMYFVAGMVSILAFRYFNRGWKQFITALITFAVLALVYLGFRAADMVAGNVWRALLHLFIGSMATVAGYPLVYLFERLFNLVSNSRLIELCDVSNPLIRELEQKAPGTFQHSLQVMNMVDAAARAIGANADLVRAGALYHDIGKMNNPLCFVENESLVAREGVPKYHAGLTPEQSAHDIIRHMQDGVEIARKNHLPDAIVDFIRSHHGTTTTGYFYSQFLRDGGDPALAGEFRYPGIKPVSKEQIILMLCDSVEAASRTLKEFTPEAYSAFVERIVSGKMDEGQFDRADISISELGTVKETLKQYLAQIHHERIVYPKQKTKKQ